MEEISSCRQKGFHPHCKDPPLFIVSTQELLPRPPSESPGKAFPQALAWNAGRVLPPGLPFFFWRLGGEVFSFIVWFDPFSVALELDNLMHFKINKAVGFQW